MLKYSKIKRYNGWLSIVQSTNTKRNESSDSRTEKHCLSHLLVPSPQDVYTFVPSNNLSFMRAPHLISLSKHLIFFKSIQQHQFSRYFTRPYSVWWLNISGSGSYYGMIHELTGQKLVRWGILYETFIICLCLNFSQRQLWWRQNWDKMNIIRYMWLLLWCPWEAQQLSSYIPHGVRLVTLRENLLMSFCKNKVTLAKSNIKDYRSYKIYKTGSSGLGGTQIWISLWK